MIKYIHCTFMAQELSYLSQQCLQSINKINDFGGILNFLEPEELWKPHQLQSWSITNKVNSFLNHSNNHLISTLRYTAKCFNKFILHSKDENERANLLSREKFIRSVSLNATMRHGSHSIQEFQSATIFHQCKYAPWS
jgi:hypothetical protein